jgi:hypothetical protein
MKISLLITSAIFFAVTASSTSSPTADDSFEVAVRVEEGNNLSNIPEADVELGLPPVAEVELVQVQDGQIVSGVPTDLNLPEATEIVQAILRHIGTQVSVMMRSYETELNVVYVALGFLLVLMISLLMASKAH